MFQTIIKNPGPVLHSLYVWAHPNLIKYLKYGLKTYIDGTFKCVPGGFKQLLILMVFEPNSKEYVPVIYGLAMDKTESTYKQFFKMIDYICEGEWNPSEVTTDFEKGLRVLCWIDVNAKQVLYYDAKGSRDKTFLEVIPIN
jgi:hypothetical protein